MGNYIKQQDERLRKQEERSSSSDLSVVPSAQSSPKAGHGIQKLPSVQMLNEDARVQA